MRPKLAIVAQRIQYLSHFQFVCTLFSRLITDNPLYTDIRYNDKIRYNDNLTVMKPSLKRQQLVTNYIRISYLIL